MTAQNRQIMLKKKLAIAQKVATQNPMALARYGMDPADFAKTLQEAVLHNPDILEATDQSLAQSLRKCCRDGLVPDGDSAVINVYKGNATVVPMVTGIRRMAHEQLGAEIRSGVVYEGDSIEIVDGAGVEAKVIVHAGMDVFKSRKADNVIGAWCWIKLPDEQNARITLYSQDEINRSRDASFAKHGPWEKWPDRMAEKACVKSAIWRLRYLVSNKAEGLFNVLKEDDERGVIDVTDQGQNEVVDHDGVQPDAEKEPPKKRTTRKSTARKAKAKEAQIEDVQDVSGSQDSAGDASPSVSDRSQEKIDPPTPPSARQETKPDPAPEADDDIEDGDFLPDDDDFNFDDDDDMSDL